MCVIVKTEYNIAKYICISKTIIIIIMVLSLTSSFTFIPQAEQGITNACESSDSQEHDLPTLAISFYTPTQPYSIAFNFKFANNFFFLFLNIENSKLLPCLTNPFDSFLSKYFVVLALSIISPNAP